VINRCSPGPHEDGKYFALLAREAASLEMYLTNPQANPVIGEAIDRIVFGTAGEPRSHARSMLLGNSVIVLLSAGS
jgi:hypothetical protein